MGFYKLRPNVGGHSSGVGVDTKYHSANDPNTNVVESDEPLDETIPEKFVRYDGPRPSPLAGRTRRDGTDPTLPAPPQPPSDADLAEAEDMTARTPEEMKSYADRLMKRAELMQKRAQEAQSKRGEASKPKPVAPGTKPVATGAEAESNEAAEEANKEAEAQAEEDEEEVEEGEEEYEDEEEDDLDSQTKEQLRETGAGLGLTLPASMSKGEMVEKIRSHRSK